MQEGKVCENIMKNYNDSITFLTEQILEENIGKTISLYGYGYHANLPYYGTFLIKGLRHDEKSNRIFINAEKISGIKFFDINYAWLEDDKFTYSDSGRYIIMGIAPFKIYTAWYNTDISEIEKVGYSFIVHDGQDIQSVLSNKININKIFNLEIFESIEERTEHEN